MRHAVDHRKLGRTSAHREALLRNLSLALFENERIKTTLDKAKELRRFAERLVTLSKRETLHARRLALRRLHDRAVVAKLFDTLSARYAQRAGGYTRIVRLGPRRGDHAEMVVIELVDAEVARSAGPAAGKGKTKGKSEPATDKAPAAEAAPAKGQREPRAGETARGPAKATRARAAGRKTGSGGKSD